MKNKINLEVDEINKKFPNIYWNPKLHKNSTKERFIIAAPKYSMKPLSKGVKATLELIYR